MVSQKQWYERANSEWPAEVPDLTGEEAIRAARKLYRFARKSKLHLPIKLTSGNRYSYPNGGVLYVNPDPGWKSGRKRHGGGWKALVHDLSHWLDPGRAHSKGHARLEARMVREVVRRGWLSGSLKSQPKPEKPTEDPRAVRQRAVLAGIERWAAKKKRAERALAKLERQRRYYERASA